MHEYTSAVFAVGLHGFAQADNDRITAMAAEGWEPTHMTPVHNGFAAVVLFRREAGPAARPAARPAAATRTRKTPPPAASSRAAVKKASTRTAAAGATRAAPTKRGRTR